MATRLTLRSKENEMKQRYPKILSWLAGRAGVPDDKAEGVWADALRVASGECAVADSPEYWQAAVDHLRASLAGHSRAASLASPGVAGASRRQPDVCMA